MEDELIFSKEWFMLEKYHFKILAVITELADNTGTFKGELTAFCKNLSTQNSSGNKNKIKSALNYLANNNYITMSEDKKIYTITLSDISEKTYQYKLKRTWYNQLRTAANKTSWENLLKIFLILLDLSKVPDNIVTYKQIGELTNCSVSTVGRAMKTIANLQFGCFRILIKPVKKKCGEIYITIGTIYEQALIFV